MKLSLNDPSLKELSAAYQASVVYGLKKRDESMRHSASALVDLLEAAGYSMNDMGALLAMVDASDSFAHAVYTEWDNRHPGSARAALAELLDGTWTAER